MNSKIRLGVVTLLVCLLLTGFQCSKKNMDELSGDGKYHYRNTALGFSLELPPEFIYYQTQRKVAKDLLVDIEFFVPTSDETYTQSVPDYAKFLVIRIYTRSFWESIEDEHEDKVLYKVVGEEDGKVYTYKFWAEAPADWQDKWSEDMKKEIAESIKLQ